LALLALALTLGSTLAACRRETGRSAADQRYVVRGEIVRLPQAGEGAPEIWLRHEAIPDFRSETGEKSISIEIAELARSFNQMTARLREKSSAQGRPRAVELSARPTPPPEESNVRARLQAGD